MLFAVSKLLLPMADLSSGPITNNFTSLTSLLDENGNGNTNDRRPLDTYSRHFVFHPARRGVLDGWRRPRPGSEDFETSLIRP